jgi:hypothetical protein
MQQPTLDVDDAHDLPPELKMAPERQQRLLVLMAEAIVSVWQSEQEANDDER